MKKPVDQTTAQLLDEETLEIIGANLRPTALAPDRRTLLRSRIMDRIDESHEQTAATLVTIRSEQGDWQEIAPKIFKKLLHIDSNSGVESYLLRVEAGAQAPAHEHLHDELCLVLEGEVCFEDVHLKTGDYHFAPKGSVHGVAHSKTGALLFLQSGLAA
ncbi:MAG TPA: cupin domain-containing protein [Crenotrichaceae bacterium]|nr:cupin domain-containing protein [Crenotrichaceae bacterium]